MEKILVVGNHTCSNRGDAAILRGLITHIQSKNPLCQVSVCSRSPDSVKQLLNMPVSVIDDVVKLKERSNPISKIAVKLLYIINIDPLVLFSICCYFIPFLKFFLPSHMKTMISEMKRTDHIIQVGGSFFVDLYGMSQFRLLMCSILADRPIYLIGHSLGPFGSGIYKIVAGWCFKKAEKIILRDKVSTDITKDAYPGLNYNIGADTAWLVDSSDIVKKAENKENVIGFTFRELAPFDKRLGISQLKYEKVMASVSEKLIESGYKLVYFSTCTSLAGYHKDDRVVAQNVKKLISPNMQEHVEVVEDEMTDVELGRSISKCKILIGTRLHSCIIGMNFGTPAIALAYEHKSLGLYQDMGLEDYAVTLSSDFSDTNVLSIIEKIESSYSTLYKKYLSSVSEQVLLAKNEVNNCFPIDLDYGAGNEC